MPTYYTEKEIGIVTPIDTVMPKMQCVDGSASWIALASLIVAICALGATIWQLRNTRRHNRLSVTPHLVWSTTNEQNKGNLVYKITIRNNGIGPAIIKDRSFSQDGRRLSFPAGVNEIEKVVESIFSGKLEYAIRSTSLVGVDAALPASDEITLIELIFANVNPTQLAQIISLAKGFSFRIRYESVYGDARELTIS